MGGMNKRQMEVGGDTCLLGFDGRQMISSAVFDAGSLSPIGGTSAVQTATMSGVPTGGTFKLIYRGEATGTIVYNATGANVQTALRALANIGATGVTVTGSAGGPWVITFAGELANQPVRAISSDGTALTGGTTPHVSVAQTTTGATNDERVLIGWPLPGTIVTKTGKTPDTVVEYTGSGSILGIVDGVEEFWPQGPNNNRDVAVYEQFCTFDATKIHNYATYKTAFDAWAAASFNIVKFGS